jgi:CheY-like chemotaxis protein
VIDVLIVDDEEPARAVLREMLAEEGDVRRPRGTRRRKRAAALGTRRHDAAPGSRVRAPRLVDGLLTGLHEPGESHFELLQAFAPRDLLEEALAHAAREGYLGHEFGDRSLVLAD